MIVRLKNLIPPTQLLAGSANAYVPLTAATKRTLKRNQLALPILHRSPESDLQGFLNFRENHQSSCSFSRFHPETIFDDFYYPNTTNKSSISTHKICSDPMLIGSGGSDRSYYHDNFHPRIGVVPLIATRFSSFLVTASTACCWSVWILLLLSAARNKPSGRNLIHHPSSSTTSWRSGILPSAVFTAITTTRMSGYSMLFADAFHPSASYSSQDHEKDNNKSEDGNNDSDKPEPSSSSLEESSSKPRGTETNPLPETTCNNDQESTGGKPHPDDDRLLMFHFDSTTSTQDEAKAIANGLSDTSSPPDTFCVTATSQTKGRGTTGRQWLGAPGNVFVTIGIPVDVWMTKMMKERRIPLTLLPLKIGDITASMIHSELKSCAKGDVATVTVKWPNDVLVDDKKISGTLIENANNWFLIGIGINVAHAPTVPTTGPDYGRPSVSLHDYCGSSNPEERDQKARDMGVQLALSFHRWIYEEDSETADMIVEGWKRWLNWDAELTMRNDANRDAPRRVVKLIDVLPDGRIKVANKGDGKEEILVSDYFV